MIYLDAMWHIRRSAVINGVHHWIPFGIDLPSSLVDFIPRWIANSGEEWTARRLKDLTLWAIHVLAGNTNFSVSWFSTIRYRGYLIPKLEIFKYLVKHRNHPNQVRLVLTVLKSYRLKTWGRPSLDSIKDSITSLPGDQYIAHFRRYTNLPKVPKSVLETTDCVNTQKSYADDIGRTHPGPYGLKDFDFPAEIRFLYEDMNQDPMILGKLVPIPDKGKWRVILVGHWAIQLQTKKLADWLRNWLWSLPEVASGKQEKMRDFIISSLEKKKYMLSIDLSQATDRLSKDIQIKLLISMGVPKRYFDFLYLPALYSPKDFGEYGTELKEIRYSNGQPMGLFLSFPMFELLHYVVLKFVVATTDATFCICGDDVVIACDKRDASNLFDRYHNLIDRFGGIISETKTVRSSDLAEGIGAVFLKGYPKELRVPSGKLSILEATSPGFWLYNSIRDMTPIGRAIHASWLTTREKNEYTYTNRRALNEELVLRDLDDWHVESLRSLATHEDYPMEWYVWEEAPSGTRMNNPLFPEEVETSDTYPEVRKDGKVEVFRFLSRDRYMNALVSHKIISLYKNEKGG